MGELGSVNNDDRVGRNMLLGCVMSPCLCADVHM